MANLTPNENEALKSIVSTEPMAGPRVYSPHIEGVNGTLRFTGRTGVKTIRSGSEPMSMLSSARTDIEIVNARCPE